MMPTYSFVSAARLRAAFSALFLLACVAAPVHAQSSDDGGTVTVGGGEALTIGGLLQTDAYLGRDSDEDGFRVRSARLRFDGEASTLQYTVQLSLASSSPLLDAYARLPLSDQLGMTAGIFKTPFSGEFLQSRPDLLFAERARVVNNVIPNRQAGVALDGTLVSDRLNATLGIFNSTGGLNPPSSNPPLYVGRLTGTLPVSGGQLKVGTNAAYSIDDNTPLSGLGQPSFTGSRVLFGADARLEVDRWLLAGELDTAGLDPDGAPDATNPLGFYLAGGADVADGHQVLLRFDNYDPDVPGQMAPDDQLTLGYNYDPSSMLRVQVNYQASTDGLDGGFVTARLQVALR